MPLLKDGKEITDIWAFVEDEAELSPGGCFTVTLGRFMSEHDMLLARNEDVGVRLGPADDPELLKPFLDRINLVEVEFPKYTDGRGYSIANLLRRRLGYEGEMRAVGQVLRDQLGFMQRAGFDQVVFDAEDAEAKYADAVKEFSAVYQAGADDRPTIFERRHGAGGQ